MPATFGGLTHCSIEGCILEDSDVAALCALGPQLASLRLAGSAASPLAAAALLPLGGALPRLRRLALAAVEGLTDGWVQQLLGTCPPHNASTIPPSAAASAAAAEATACMGGRLATTHLPRLDWLQLAGPDKGVHAVAPAHHTVAEVLAAAHAAAGEAAAAAGSAKAAPGKKLPALGQVPTLTQHMGAVGLEAADEPQLDDAGLAASAACAQLSRVHLSHLPRVSLVGLVQLAKRCPDLEWVDIGAGCPRILRAVTGGGSANAHQAGCVRCVVPGGGMSSLRNARGWLVPLTVAPQQGEDW